MRAAVIITVMVVLIIVAYVVYSREIPDPFEVAIEWDNEPMFQNCTFVEPNEPNDCKVSYDLVEGVFYAFKYDDGGWILTEIDTSAIEVNDCLLVDN